MCPGAQGSVWAVVCVGAWRSGRCRARGTVGGCVHEPPRGTGVISPGGPHSLEAHLASPFPTGGHLFPVLLCVYYFVCMSFYILRIVC